MTHIKYKYITTLTLLLNVVPTHALHQQAPIRFRDAANYYLPSFGVVDTSNQNTLEPSDHDKRATAFFLFDDLLKKDAPLHHYVEPKALRALLTEMHIFCGKPESASKHVFAKLDFTHTVFGQAVLAHMLANPLQDVAVLRARQDFVKQLITDEELYEQLTALVSRCKEIENAIVPLWKTKHPITKSFAKKFYFSLEGFEQFNSNQYVLEASNRLLPMMSIITHLGLDQLMAAQYAWIKHQEAYKQRPAEYAEHMKSVGKSSTPPSLFSLFWQYWGNAWSPTHVADDETWKAQLGKAHVDKSGIGQWNQYGIYFWFIVTKFNAIRSIYTSEAARKQFLDKLQATLIGLKELTAILKKCESLVTSHPHLSALLEHASDLERLCNSEPSHDFKELQALLKTSTFKTPGVSLLPPHMGRILVAYKHADVVRKELVGPMHVLGQLDAYLSIATLVKTFATERVNYNFVEYLQDETPSMELQQFWNPSVDPRVVVANDFAMGTQNTTRNVILTGSNTGGKSTQMKGILLNILLAQTLGVAPSRSMCLTPFGYLGTSLNISDDQEKGDSAFKAEVKRAKDLLESTQSFDSNCFGFTIIDEPFKGTNPKSNANACSMFTRRLMPSPYGLFILATHSHEFIAECAQLEQETKGLLKLYKIEVTRQPDGSLKHRYTIEPGISTSNIAEDILREEFDSLTGEIFA